MQLSEVVLLISDGAGQNGSGLPVPFVIHRSSLSSLFRFFSFVLFPL
jgi:hypothetical protein